VCSQPFDHTSVLQFLERFTGVRETNITDWRRKTFGDLTAAFRFDQARAEPPVVPDTGAMLHMANYSARNLALPPIPGAEQAMPVQEQGTRRQIPPPKA
jgi:phospholipase C